MASMVIIDSEQRRDSHYKLLKIVGLFCRIWSFLHGSFAKEIYNFKEPTNRSHPIDLMASIVESRLFYRALLQKRLII